MTTISLPLLSRSEWGRESPPPSVPIKIPYHRPIGSKTAPGSKRSQKPAGERGHGLKKRISVSKRDHVNTFEAYSNVEGVAWLCGLLLFKLVLTCATDGASPVIRKIFKRGSRFYATVRVSIGRVVHIAANRANILVHPSFLLH
jgi:hypothetical protein